MLDIILNRAAQKSNWIYWLVNDNGNAARSTREFLNICIANVCKVKQRRIYEKLSADENEIEATIHELVAHELLLRLGLSPQFEPSLNGLTPDLSFNTEGKLFIADVYLTHSPSRTFRDFGDGTGEAWDTARPNESRAHKISQQLEGKTVRYSQLKLPLVIFVFLGDHRILSVRDVEQALFGMTAYEVSLEDRFPKSVDRRRTPLGGLLLPDEDGNFFHCNLSAVIACDWFDTLNRQDQGKRLHCVVLHNWVGEALPIDAFNVFPQIVWNQVEPGIWKPEQTTNIKNIVAKFTSNGQMEYREYTPNTAW